MEHREGACAADDSRGLVDSVRVVKSERLRPSRQGDVSREVQRSSGNLADSQRLVQRRVPRDDRGVGRVAPDGVDAAGDPAAGTGDDVAGNRDSPAGQQRYVQIASDGRGGAERDVRSGIAKRTRETRRDVDPRDQRAALDRRRACVRVRAGERGRTNAGFYH